MPSILLLIERRNEGQGATIPLRNRATKIVVEGVAHGDGVMVCVRSPEYDCRYDDPIRSILVQNGETELEEPIEAGVHLRARLIGSNSIATVWVE